MSRRPAAFRGGSRDDAIEWVKTKERDFLVR